jgi:hypothetical protein
MIKKIIFVSVCFTVVFASLLGCKKKESLLGKEIYDQDMLLDANGVDTFSIVAYTELIDSTITKNPTFSLLGRYKDATFGDVVAGFYTQIRLSAANPNFGDISAITVDSVVLALEYSDIEFYGLGNYPLDFEVRRLSEPIDSTFLYLNSSSTATEGGNLIKPGFSNFTPSVSKVIVGSDTLEPQMRLRLNESLGMELINSSTQGHMTSNEAFLQFFKGLYVSCVTQNIPGENGAVYSFNLLDPDSKLTIYYKQNDELKSFDLVINNRSQRYNRVLYDNAGSPVASQLLDSTLGNKEFYMQNGNARAIINFPTVKNLNNKTVVHRATLYLPYQWFNGDGRYPSNNISVFNKRVDGDQVWGILGIPLVPQFSRYTIDVTPFIQGLIKQNPIYSNPSIFVVGARTNDNVERIIFNGINSTNKYRPKLIITYTEF